MSIRALLVALAFVCALPVATRAEPTPAPAKVLLAAQQPLRHTIDAQRPQLQARADALTARHRRCLPRAKEIYAAVGSDTYAVWTAITRYEDFEDTQEALRPLAGEISAYATRLLRLRTGDRVLDRAARAQERLLRWTLALPPLDACAMASDWRSHGFDPEQRPAAMRALDRGIEAAPILSVARALEAAERRLHHLGLSADDAARALESPDTAVPVARPAQRNFEWHGPHGHGHIDRDGNVDVQADAELG